jgi:hypothetical protein
VISALQTASMMAFVAFGRSATASIAGMSKLMVYPSELAQSVRSQSRGGSRKLPVQGSPTAIHVVRPVAARWEFGLLSAGLDGDPNIVLPHIKAHKVDTERERPGILLAHLGNDVVGSRCRKAWSA